MSGINEIIQWSEQELDFTLENTVQEEFVSISEIFTRDSRLPLEDILGDELPRFKQYIADRLAREQQLSETDEATDEQVQRVDELERGIERLSRQIQEGGTFRAGARAVKESEFVLNDTLQGIVNFFKGLFR